MSSTYYKFANSDVPSSVASGIDIKELKNRDPQTCISECDNTANCAGFAFVKSGKLINQCYLKKRTAGANDISTNNAVDLYSKNMNIRYNSNNPLPDAYNDTNYPKLDDYAKKHKITFPQDCTTDACKIEYVQKHMRDNMDNKVAEIYHATGTNTAAFEDNFRTTMLVGVVWAMLGTTVLYYTFKNL
jgi:PAN domain